MHVRCLPATKYFLLGVIVFLSALWSVPAFSHAMDTQEQVTSKGYGDQPATVNTGKPFKVLAKNLEVVGGSRSGEAITIILTIETSGTSTRAVPWYIYAYDRMAGKNTIIGNGIKNEVAGGTTFTVSTTWVAQPGRFEFTGYIDPIDFLKIDPSEWDKKASPTIPRFFSDWPSWIAAAKQGVKLGLPQWIKEATFDDVVINGTRATGGKLGGPDLFPLISGQMMQIAPSFVAEGLLGGVVESWQAWAGSVSVPNLEWYPQFGEVAGAEAAQVANAITSLSALKQDTAVISPEQLSESIRMRLGGADDWPEGNKSIDEFCHWFASEIETWRQNAQITGVMGSGPVPAYNPPLVTAGPVVNGKGSGGKIIGTPQW